MGSKFYMPRKVVRPQIEYTNAYACGTVTDKNGVEYDVKVFGKVDYEPPKTHGRPEDCHDGHFDAYVTSVRVYNGSGGWYERPYERFDKQAQTEIDRLFFENYTPMEGIGCE